MGRYYLALPLNPAFNAAGATLATCTYYTYGGIDSNGYPTDLTAFSGAVSSNNNYGLLPDAKTVATSGIEPSYQDEFFLGFSKALGQNWVYGAKATYRVLRSGVDDYCDIDAVLGKASSLGYNVTKDSNPVSCWLINPGRANTFNLVDTSGNYVSVPLSNAEMGFPRFKRNYYAVNLSLEHPFDGRWYARAEMAGVGEHQSAFRHTVQCAGILRAELRRSVRLRHCLALLQRPAGTSRQPGPPAVAEAAGSGRLLPSGGCRRTVGLQSGCFQRIQQPDGAVEIALFGAGSRAAGPAVWRGHCAAGAAIAAGQCELRLLSKGAGRAWEGTPARVAGVGSFRNAKGSDPISVPSAVMPA